MKMELNFKNIRNVVAFIVIVFTFSLFLWPGVMMAKTVAIGDMEDDMFLEVSLSPSKTVAGAPVLYEVALYSRQEGLSILNSPELPDFSGFEVVNMGGVSDYGMVKVKGKEYYRFVLSRIYLANPNPGKYKFSEGKFIIGVPTQRVVNDPFWGRTRQSYYRPVELHMPAVALKLSELPSPPSGVDFSGGVGEFNVNVWIPEGYIAAGEEAVAIVTVSGYGLLSDARIPSLKEAFSGTVRLKSVSEERQKYLNNGRIFSEIEMECTFIPMPEDGACAIGEVEFCYYSPSDRKYIVAKSKPVEVPLSGVGSSKPPVIIGI